MPGRQGTAPTARTDAGAELQRLEVQASSVLSVLVLAALSEGTFPDGWVSLEDFATHGGYVGDVKNPKRRESLGKALQRAVGKIRALPIGLAYGERGGRKGVEKERRLLLPLPLAVDLWFRGRGKEYLRPESWAIFLQANYQPVLTVEDALQGLEPVVIHRLLITGEHDKAIERARDDLDQATNPRSQGPILLALATALIRRSQNGDWAEAEALLTDLLEKPRPVLDLHDHLTLVRAKLRLAYCQFLRHVRGQQDTESVRSAVDTIRTLLAEAAMVAHDLSLADRGQITNLEGLLLKWEAQVESDSTLREELFAQAERHLRRTLTIWQGAQDGYLLGSLLYNLGELQYARYQLDLGQATATQVRETLAWYEASIRLGEELGGQHDLFLDYGRAIECIALLLEAGADEPEEARRLLARAKRYLTVAHRCPEDSWQGKLVARAEVSLRRAVPDLRNDDQPVDLS